jgi:hypothetical protein
MFVFFLNELTNNLKSENLAGIIIDLYLNQLNR